VRPQLRVDGESVYDSYKGPEPSEIPYCSLRGQKLQVITKIVDYQLRPGQTHSGVWHVERVSHEEIVLTALYTLDRDESLEGAALHSKRAFLRDEALVLHEELSYGDVVRPQSVGKVAEDGHTPLSTVQTPRAVSLSFQTHMCTRLWKW